MIDRGRLATAGLWLAIATPLVYVAIRLLERAARGGLDDPTLILSETHRGLYWRAGIAAWSGLVAAVVAWFAGAAHASSARRLGAFAVGAAVVVVAAALGAP